jgi:hypothetical protein
LRGPFRQPGRVASSGTGPSGGPCGHCANRFSGAGGEVDDALRGEVIAVQLDEAGAFVATWSGLAVITA